MEEKTFRVGIIGMGKGGMCLARLFLDDPNIELVGVANRNQQAKGALWAKENGIYYTPDFNKLLEKPGLNLIVDASGNSEVEARLKKMDRSDIEIIMGASAELMWKLIDERETKEIETRKSLAEQRMLYEIGINLSNAEKSDQALRMIVQAAMDLLEMSAGSAALFDESKGEMKNVVAIGFKDTQALDFTWSVRPGGFTSHVLSNKKPTTIENVGDNHKFDASMLIDQGIRSLIAVPLKAEGRLVGILYTDNMEPRKFSNREINVMELLGAMAATAVEKILMLEKAEELALTDELTKLYNHRFFVRGLMSELKRAKRYGEPVSLFMIDVDYFKKFNDTHGHLKGNVVLQEIASLLVTETRQTDMVARYGGEEFAVILPKSDKKSSLKLGERVRKSVFEHSFEGEDTQPGGKITVSIGVATYPDDISSHENINGLIELADKALYRSKSAGRNTITAH